MTHGGAPVTTVTMTVSAGTGTYEFDVEFTEPRRGPVRVADALAGEVTVAPADEPTPTPDGSGADGGDVPATLLVLVFLAALWRRTPANRR